MTESECESNFDPFSNPDVQKHLALRLLKDSVSGLGWRYWSFVASVIIFALISLLPPQLFRFFTQNTQTLSSINAEQFLLRLVLFGGFVGLMLFLSSVGNTLIHEWLRLRLEAELRAKVLSRLHDIPLSVLDGAQRGDWLTRMTGDLGQVEGFFTHELPNQIRHAAVLIGAGILFFYYSGFLALMPLATALVLAFLNLRVQRRLAPKLAELRQLHGGVFQLLIESLEGIRTIRSHGGQRYIQKRFNQRLSEITTKSMKVVQYLGALMGGTDFSAQIMVTVCLAIVAFALTQSRMTIEEVLIYPFFIGVFYGAAQGLASSAYDWNRFFIEGGRLGEILYHQSSMGQSAPDRVIESILFTAYTLDVSQMEVGYRQSLCRPIDFQVRRGELCGIIGPSGCGKSTFLEVLAGLRPALQGTCLIRDRDGRVVWQSSSQKFPQLPMGPCAFVEQHPYIFEGTLRENLTFGNPDHLSDAVLSERLERASLNGFVRMYGGLGHQLKDRGRNLSEGERYRIALCRALLLNRPFLLLDEPFAALDEVSVAMILETLDTEKKNCGIAVVTHYVPEALHLNHVLNLEHFFLGRMTTKQGQELGKAKFPGTGETTITQVIPISGGMAAMNNNNNQERGLS